MVVGKDQIDDYERNGFIRVKGFLTSGEVAELRRQIERYSRQVLASLPPADYVLEADGRSVRNLWRMERHDRFFDALTRRKDILAVVASLVHGTPALIGAETFNKPARIGSGVPPHQDNAYFCQQPPDVLTVWIAVDPATAENGPIYYVKGTHKLGLLPHRASGVAGNSMGLAEMPDVKESDRFCGTLAPGDALIHHCETIHYSAPNTSDHARCGFLLVYRGEHTRDNPAHRAAYVEAQRKKAKAPA